MKSLILLALVLIAPTIFAAEGYTLVDDLENCQWRDGSKITWEECDNLNLNLYSVSARLEHFKDKLKEPDTQKLAARLIEKQVAELDQYTKDLMERSFKISKNYPDLYGQQIDRTVAGIKMSLPIDPEVKTPQDIEIERIIADKKRSCGKDYKQLYIGMKVGLMIVCYGAYYESKTVGSEGVIEYYQTLSDWVIVQDGIVINYIKRRD